MILTLRRALGGLLLATAILGAGVARAEIAPHEVVMSIAYGFGTDQIDTTLCEYGAYWKSLIANYRVGDEESLWLLTSGSRPSVRRFESVDGRAVQRERIDLPIVPGGYDDFLIDGGVVILSQSLTDMKDQATFYRVAGDSIAQKVTLSRKVGYNRIRGWGVANLGRLRGTGGDLYNCFVRMLSCIRIGTATQLFPRLETADLVPGVPTATGDLVWADRLIVSRGIVPVLDLSAGLPAELEEVFDDGGFVIRRIVADRKVRAVEARFEIYDAAGALRRDIIVRVPVHKFFTVGEGEIDFFTPRSIYQLEFDRKEIRLIRY